MGRKGHSKILTTMVTEKEGWGHHLKEGTRRKKRRGVKN